MQAQLSLLQSLHSSQTPAPSACARIPVPGPHSNLEIPASGPGPRICIAACSQGVPCTVGLGNFQPRVCLSGASQGGQASPGLRGGEERTQGREGAVPGARQEGRGLLPGLRGACAYLYKSLLTSQAAWDDLQGTD